MKKKRFINHRVIGTGLWFLFVIVGNAVPNLDACTLWGGTFAVKKTSEGTLSHTNHYLDAEMQKYNQKIGDSSATRFSRIQELLGEKKGGHDLEDFAAMSRDSVAGPDNSIWRTGSTSAKTRTLATWIVYQPIQGVSRLFVRIANPGESEQRFEADCASLFQ